MNHSVIAQNRGRLLPLVFALSFSPFALCAESPVTVDVVSAPFDIMMGLNDNPFIVSPDGLHTAFIANRGSRRVVELDGRPGPAFSKIERVQFSGDSSTLVYVGHRGDGQVFVRANSEGVAESPEFRQVEQVQLSPTGATWLFTARLPGEAQHSRLQPPQVFLSNGCEGPFEDAWIDSGVAFSPDGAHLAYLAKRNVPNPNTSASEQYHLVIDGTPGPVITPYHDNDWNKTLLFGRRHNNWGVYSMIREGRDTARWMFQSVAGQVEVLPGLAVPGIFAQTTDRAHFAYVTYEVKAPVAPRKAGVVEYQVHLDGRTIGKHTAELRSMPLRGGAHSGISHLTLSPDGSRTAYALAEKMRYVFACVDGVKSDLDFASCDGIAFSPDGRRVAYAATSRDGKGFAVVDGHEYGPYGSVVSELAFSRDGQHVMFFAHVNDRGSTIVDGRVLSDEIRPSNLAFLSGAIAYPVISYGSQGKLQHELVVLQDGEETRLPLEGAPIANLSGDGFVYPISSETSAPANVPTVSIDKVVPAGRAYEHLRFDEIRHVDGHIVSVLPNQPEGTMLLVNGTPTAVIEEWHHAPVRFIRKDNGAISFFALRENSACRVVVDPKLASAAGALPAPRVRARADSKPAPVTKISFEKVDASGLGAVSAAATDGSAQNTATTAATETKPEADAPASSTPPPRPTNVPPVVSEPVDAVNRAAESVGDAGKKASEALGGLFKKKKKNTQ